MRRYHETFRLWEYLLFTLVTLAVLCLCVCVGSVRIPLSDTLSYLRQNSRAMRCPQASFLPSCPSACRAFYAWR